MSDLTRFEKSFATALEAHLGPRRPVEARSIAAAAIAGRTTPTLIQRRRWPLLRAGVRPLWPLPSLAWIVLATAVLVVALVLAFVAGRQPTPQPTPTDASAVFTPSPTNSPPPTGTAAVTPHVTPPTPWPTLPLPLPTLLPMEGPFVPVLFREFGEPGRGVDVIAIEPDGSERLIRRLSATDSGLAGASIVHGATVTIGDYGAVSGDGWLAVPIEVGGPGRLFYAFYDLGNVSDPAMIVPSSNGVSGVWGPTGLFAVVGGFNGSHSADHIIDPRARSVSDIDLAAIGGGPTIFWAADGSGLLGTTSPGAIGLIRIDAAASVPGIPAIADRVGMRPFGRDGLFLCKPDDWSLAFGDPACQTAAIATRSLTTEGLPWADATLLGGLVRGASFEANRTALWALTTDQSSPTPVSIVRLANPGRGTTAISIDSAVLPDSANVAFRFAGFAPDDSIIVLRQVAGDQQFLLAITMDGSAATSHLGSLAGFVPAELANSWPTIERP